MKISKFFLGSAGWAVVSFAFAVLCLAFHEGGPLAGAWWAGAGDFFSFMFSYFAGVGALVLLWVGIIKGHTA